MNSFDPQTWEIAPFFPIGTYDDVPPYRYAGHINFGYVRQRMRQVQRNHDDNLAPAQFKYAYPPHALDVMRSIDWETSEFALAFAFTSRLIWLWMLRNEQLDARLHISGDTDIYAELSAALNRLLLEGRECSSLAHSARLLVPVELPEADDDAWHGLDAQRDTLLHLGTFLRDIAGAAANHGRAYRDPRVNTVLYPYDHMFYAYRSRVHDHIIRHGRETGPGFRKVALDVTGLANLGARAILPFGRKRRARTLSVATYAAQRLLMLWQVFGKLKPAREPTEDEQAAYIVEWDVLARALEVDANRYGELRFRMQALVPVYLYAFQPVRSSVDDIPQSPPLNIRQFLEDVNRTAMQLGETIRHVPDSDQLGCWYTPRQEARLQTVLRSLRSQRFDLIHANCTITNSELPGASGPSSPEPEGTPSEGAGTRAIESVPGRPAVDLAYELARSVWWDLVDEMAPRKPTQAILCDRLTDLGHPIAVRTFGQKCRNWREQGLPWPGPRPEEPLESA